LEHSANPREERSRGRLLLVREETGGGQGGRAAKDAEREKGLNG